MNRPVRIAVFASGRGSNFRAIHRVLAEMPDAPATVTLCLSNNTSPGAFEYALEAGIETLRLSPRMFEREEEYDRTLLDALRERGIDMIVLAGYMRKIPSGVVRAYRGRILNIHPALLPKFGGEGMYGLNVHRAVVEAGEAESGVTVHLVDDEYDTGAIVARQSVPVNPDDTAETLAERVLAVEHSLYPRVVLEWAGRIRRGELVAPDQEISHEDHDRQE